MWRSKHEIDDGMACGEQAWLRRRSVDSFFPASLLWAPMLEEGVGDHCHESVTMKTLPGSSLEVIEAEFLLQLLIGSEQGAQVCRGG
jgi:hypothetical protein